MNISPHTHPHQRLVSGAAALMVAVCAVAVSTAPGADAATPPTTVVTGGVTVSQVRVNGYFSNNVTVTDGQHVIVTGSYANRQPGTSIEQIQIGWAGTDRPLGCLYDEARGDRASGRFTYDLGPAPRAGQINQVLINFAQDWSCGASTLGWWFGNQDPVIARVASTAPAPSGPTGPDVS